MTENNVTIVSPLDEALIHLLGTLTLPLEASQDSDLVVYPKEVIIEALDALCEILEHRMELKEDE